MVFPARTDEAFGMVMAESMACGTPVIAYNHSALPEVISIGKTGYIVENIEDMISKVKDIPKIDRRNCRVHSMQKFDVTIIASQYLNLL
jgi:glycosyltransferase involved in cell wall biosynthesis